MGAAMLATVGLLRLTYGGWDIVGAAMVYLGAMAGLLLRRWRLAKRTRTPVVREAGV